MTYLIKFFNGSLITMSWQPYNQKTQIDVSILHFSKAFDTVPNNFSFGSVTFNRKQSVIVNYGNFSKYTISIILIIIRSWIPQGTILEPLFYYALMTYHLTQFKKWNFCQWFLLYTKINNNQDCLETFCSRIVRLK